MPPVSARTRYVKPLGRLLVFLVRIALEVPDAQLVGKELTAFCDGQFVDGGCADSGNL